MISTPSRFASLARWQALLVVAGVLLVMLGGITFQMHNRFLPGASTAAVSVTSAAATSTAADNDDLAMYQNITRRMAKGEPYYATVVERHRTSGYPLRPFITVRLPTLAYIGATLGLDWARAVLVALLIATLACWWMRLKRVTDTVTLQPVICVLVIATGTFSFAITPNLVVSHEVWAGTLMALSWALWGGFGAEAHDRRALSIWLPSVLLAALAVLIRETALPFVLLMGAFAVWRRHWMETVGWAAVVGLFAVAMAMHANSVFAATSPADLASPGWTVFAGWPFFVLAMHATTGLRILPEWSGAIAVPLTMLGWASWRSNGHTDTGAFGCLLFAGYALIFMVLGRPDNWYWGLLISPLFLLGLMFAPQAIVDLVAAIRRGALVNRGDALATDTQWPTTSARPAAAR